MKTDAWICFSNNRLVPNKLFHVNSNMFLAGRGGRAGVDYVHLELRPSGTVPLAACTNVEGPRSNHSKGVSSFTPGPQPAVPDDDIVQTTGATGKGTSKTASKINAVNAQKNDDDVSHVFTTHENVLFCFLGGGR